jgi:hypothetical protein
MSGLKVDMSGPQLASDGQYAFFRLTLFVDYVADERAPAVLAARANATRLYHDQIDGPTNRLKLQAALVLAIFIRDRDDTHAVIASLVLGIIAAGVLLAR